MKKDYSVLMSLYIKEKPENLVECFESLINQTVSSNEWVIVKDGPLSLELENVLNDYEKRFPGLIHYVVFKKNQGLGIALREGVKYCTNELIARMDTDDICVSYRMEKQLKEFENNSNLDICGSHIKEFENDVDNVLSERKVPLGNDEIRKYQKRRSAFNHMTVMFKKSSVLKAGNYEHAPLMEDDMLWINMLKTDCIGMNIDEYLVFARTGIDMIMRRGGFSYFKKYKVARKKILDTGFITYFDYLDTLIFQFFICIMPKAMRKYVFIKLLRRKRTVI